MGYDPYDYYDLGDFNQKGRTKTWFGNQAELMALINAAHTANMQVYADLVLDHNNGGDAQEQNPIDGKTRWTVFNPAQRQVPAQLGILSSLALRNFRRDDLRRHARSLPSQSQGLRRGHQPGAMDGGDLGFDGFRFDFVKGYAPWMVKAIAELRYLNKGDAGLLSVLRGRVLGRRAHHRRLADLDQHVHGQSRLGVRFSAALRAERPVRHLRIQPAQSGRRRNA